MLQSAPHLHAFALRQAGVVNEQPTAEDVCQSFGHLCRDGNLGQEVERLLSLAEGVEDEVEEDLRLARRRGAMEQADRLRSKRCADGFVSRLLRWRERSGGVRDAIEEEGARLDCVLHEHQCATANESREQGGRGAGSLQQFFPWNLLPTAGREGLGHVEEVEQQTLLTGGAAERIEERPQAVFVEVNRR